ncbi:MAG: GatB/YqeY domain-containing protein [Patescibacteria group bacterium]
MSLIKNIQTDLMVALKAGDVKTKETLRFIVSQLKYKEIELKREANDEEVIAAIRKQIKELEEAKSQFETAGRKDLTTENEEQVKVLQKYLPVEISDVELEKMVRGFIEANREAYNANPKALTGKVIGALKTKAAPSRIASVYGKITQ